MSSFGLCMQHLHEFRQRILHQCGWHLECQSDTSSETEDDIEEVASRLEQLRAEQQVETSARERELLERRTRRLERLYRMCAASIVLDKAEAEGPVDRSKYQNEVAGKGSWSFK